VELFPVKGHTDKIHSMSWSPDGKRLATASADGTAKIWDAAGDRGLVTFKGDTDQIDSVSWSPDGERLAIGSEDGTVKVWDAANCRELLSLKGHTDGVDSVCWSPDGNRLATGSFDGTSKVWDVTTRGEMLILQGRRVCWSPDGTRLATVCEDGAAKIWDTRDGRQVHHLDGHRSVVTAVSWSPDGKRLATASADGTIIVWDATRGRELASLPGHTSAISVVVWSPDGRRLASACAGYGWEGLSDVGEVKIWDAADGREMLTLKGHTGKVNSVSWSPNGKRLAIGSYDGTVKVWDASSGREQLGYTGGISSVSWSPDGQRLALGSWDGTVKLQEATNSAAVQEWARRDRALDEGLTRKALRDPHAQGFIRTWLVLLPLPLADGESGVQAMDRQQLVDEANLRPRVRERVSINGRELVWREHCSPEAIVDFNALLGRTTDCGVAYAVCYVHSDRAQDDLWLQIGSDDQAKLYLNGRKICESRPTRPLNGPDPPRGPFALKQGTNVLVFKVVNTGADWEGCVRLVDEAGRPAKEVHVKLTP
jgi:WD40 repeat protein